MTRNRLGLVLLLMVLFSALARAQEDYDDSDDDDNDVPGASGLSLRFDEQGGASVSFGLPARPANWDNIRQSVAASLHCPLQRLESPSLTPQTQRAMTGWAVARREKYQQYFADYRQRQLVGGCESVLAWNGFGRSGKIDLSSLAAQLKQADIKQLWVSISYPKAQAIEYSTQNLSSPPQNGIPFVVYVFPIDGRDPAPIEIFFGLGKSGFYKSLAIAIGFVLFPLALTLYMRRAALVNGRSDPTAAWFSYFRTINWSVNGALLLWITSGLGARQSLQDCVRYAVAPGWLATLLDVLVVVGPGFLVYFFCVAISYPLHVELRGSTWTRREFLSEQLVNVGAQALPLMFFLGAVTNIAKNGTTAAIFFLGAIFGWIVFRSLKMRVSKSYPYSLTRGELRDRVFALAAKAGMSITQIFVLPTGKSQMANAFASGNRVVMFTDYLLQHLTRREVEGVAAHEIAHIQLGHVRKRALMFYGAFLLPPLIGSLVEDSIRPYASLTSVAGLAGHLYGAIVWFWQWSQRDFVLILIGLSLFYLLSRRFEHEADERGAELTGDAEAQISGLLKLSRLNLMPIHWSKGTEAWLTHPSMVRRAERIAASSGMSAEQLQTILDRHRSEIAAGTETKIANDDHYAVPEATDPENLRAAAKKQSSHQFRLWSSLLMHVLPPAGVVFVIRRMHLDGNAALLAYLLGIVATPALSIMYSAWLGLHGRRAQKIRLQERAGREGTRASESAITVGFSPGAVVRFYGSNYYNWDIGLIELADEGLMYRGEQIRFVIPRSQIDGITLGQGGPSWWKFPRVYVRWVDGGGKPGVFSIASLEPCSIWEIRRQAEALATGLNQWRSSGAGFVSRAEAAQPPPAIGEIT